ncbi:hypothetical protein [Methanobrevibacter sp. DSM 116169]|uniref:hypothetical protein n=1 Tax=Methanobrevibacter sp. DSM 116169 TaxID=3242727 RepID=UPI0038FCBEB4
MSRKIFITDCEGPLTLNDNAFELCDNFISDGDKLFKILSAYDDYLVDVVKKEGYNAGNTLKFIIPFLKAENLTNQDLINFSKKNILEFNCTKNSFQYIKKFMNSYIVSTSYGQYIEAVCDYFDFSFENTFYTFIDMDEIILNEEDTKKIKKFKEIILKADLKKSEDIDKLDKIFFEEFPKMNFYENYSKIVTVGGSGKQLAVDKIIKIEDVEPNQLFYIGDSITDADPLRFVKENDGLSISFNGNEFALDAAEIAIISPNGVITGVIAHIFSTYGKEHVLKFIEEYNITDDMESLFEKYKNNAFVSKIFFEKFYDKRYPIIEVITNENRQDLLESSIEMRKNVRGDDIGNLG